MNLKQLDNFHKSKTGYLVFGLVELGLLYLFVTLALNSGSLWQWTLAGFMFIGVLQNFGRLIGMVVHGNKTSET